MPDQIITPASGPASMDMFMMQDNGVIKATGSVAQKLLASNFNINALRLNNVLRKEEWLQFDERLIEISRQRLRAVADVLEAGLTLNLANGMGTTVVQWETSSDMDPAIRSMDGLNRDRDDRVEFNINNLPIYITHKDFTLNLRHLMASRERGEPIDVTQIDVCTRRVSDSLEDALVNGVAGYTVAGNTIYGYTTHPNRNTYELTNSWQTASGADIVTDVLAMITISHAINMYGPFVIYVPTAEMVNLQNDHKTESERTILERVLAIDSITDVRVLDTLTADNILMVQMTRDVVDMVVGQQPTVVQWEEQGGFKINFKVLSIMVPRIKSDFNGVSGIVHGSTVSGGG